MFFNGDGLAAPGDKRMTHLKSGFRAPRFQLPDQDGNLHTDAEFRGKNLVLFFYPHDDDPAAAEEARAFARRLDRFHRSKAEVVGISVDDPERHQDFAQRNGIGFALLSDPQKKAIKAYGVLRGDAAAPEAFLIRDGRIVQTYPQASAKEVQHILNDVRHLK